QTLCEFNQFRCKNGTCLSNSAICDQKSDCREAEDEMLCDALPTTVVPTQRTTATPAQSTPRNTGVTTEATSPAPPTSTSSSPPQRPVNKIFTSSGIQKTKYYVEAIRGETAILPCRLEFPDDLVQAKWTKQDRGMFLANENSGSSDALPKATRRVTGSPETSDFSMRIRNTQYNDTGKYFCIESSREVIIKAVHLEILDPPPSNQDPTFDTETTEYLTVNWYDNVTLPCTVTHRADGHLEQNNPKSDRQKATKLCRFLLHGFYHTFCFSNAWGSVAEWLARRIRGLEIASLIPDHAMLQLSWENSLP
ncbi:basement membrane-specific heparan sulfate proteoglycan core protein, partial [Elysia marginata]